MSISNVQFNVNDELKSQAAAICEQFGVDLSAMLKIFMQKMVTEKNIPFVLDSNSVLALKLAEYKNYKEIKKSAEKEIKRLEEELKMEMDLHNVDTLSGCGITLKYIEFARHSFDTTGFKTENPEIYEQYTKEVLTHRWIFSEPLVV